MKKIVLAIIFSFASIFCGNEIWAQSKKPGIFGKLFPKKDRAEKEKADKEIIVDKENTPVKKVEKVEKEIQANKIEISTLRPTVEKRTNQLQKELNLDDEQADEIRLLLNRHFEKVSRIKAKHSGDENFIENLQLKAARKEFHRELNSILDAEQRKKMEAFKEGRKMEKRVVQK